MGGFPSRAGEKWKNLSGFPETYTFFKSYTASFLVHPYVCSEW
jgi:hypothetical protein